MIHEDRSIFSHITHCMLLVHFFFCFCLHLLLVSQKYCTIAQPNTNTFLPEHTFSSHSSCAKYIHTHRECNVRQPIGLTARTRVYIIELKHKRKRKRMHWSTYLYLSVFRVYFFLLSRCVCYLTYLYLLASVSVCVQQEVYLIALLKINQLVLAMLNY